jgi:epoxyqueuosine reductase
MSVSEEIRNKLSVKGASMIGYADLKDVPEQNRMGFRYGISIAVALNPEIVSGIQNGPTNEYYNEYNRLNVLLDDLGQYAVNLLEESEFKAFPLTRSNVVEDDTTWRTMLPHKTVATLAGLGWIGKCAMLVTKPFGSAVRITSVLTNAQLETSEPIRVSQCGSCSVCKNICPGNAVLGTNWAVDKDRDTFYDAFACRKAARERTSKIGIEATLCGLCMYSCPNTQRYLNKGGLLW